MVPLHQYLRVVWTMRKPPVPENSDALSEPQCPVQNYPLVNKQFAIANGDL
jgi:hypothetical protein